MNRRWIVLFVLCGGSSPVLAQDAGVNVSVGVRAWYTEWTTFSYHVDPLTGENDALTQVSADSEPTFLPIVSVRYGKWLASTSAMLSRHFTFPNGRGTRKEFDANVGYSVLPGLAFTLGYKQVSQADGPARYRPRGPTLGATGNASLGGAWSMYGSLGLGWLETPDGDDIAFDADYQLAELGLAYSLEGNRMPRRWTFTGGYRYQAMKSKDAFESQDGRDTTQGFTIGMMATF
jgi:hypothetical protein